LGGAAAKSLSACHELTTLWGVFRGIVAM